MCDPARCGLGSLGVYPAARIVKLTAGSWQSRTQVQNRVSRSWSTTGRARVTCSRIVQAALKIVLEPVFEADFLPCSFGFRPRRSAHDALQVLIDESWRGRRWVGGNRHRELF
jgi:hypothetical protein